MKGRHRRPGLIMRMMISIRRYVKDGPALPPPIPDHTVEILMLPARVRQSWTQERIPIQVSPAEHWDGVRQIEEWLNGAGAPVA